MEEARRIPEFDPLLQENLKIRPGTFMAQSPIPRMQIQ
jgi:hypothetical protein